MNAFFTGVCYLLNDNGTFVYTDFRTLEEMNALEALVEKYFEIIKKTEINKNVRQALINTTALKTKLIE